MWASIEHGLAVLLLSLWVTFSSHSWRRLPRPTAEPLVVVAGPDADRLLVMGSGAVVGYGVLSWNLSVSGQVARLVAAATGRGIRVDIQGRPDLSLARARTVIDSTDLVALDVIVLSLGSLDAVQLVPPRQWRHQLATLLDLIAARGPQSLRVVVVGVPQIETLVSLPAVVRAPVGRRCAAFNAETAAELRGRENMRFLDFAPPSTDLMQNAGRQVHSDWAELIAPSVVAALRPPAPTTG